MLLAESEDKILHSNKLAETYLEQRKSKGSYRSSRRWRVVAIQMFPDASSASIDAASELTPTGLSSASIDGKMHYFARLRVLHRDLSKTQARSFL